MHPYHGLPIYDLRNKLEGLSKKKNALKIIKTFYDCYSYAGANDELWYLLNAALTNDDADITSIERSNMLFFYECFLSLNKAIDILLGKTNSKKKKKNKK
jgi:hypothetical protein